MKSPAMQKLQDSFAELFLGAKKPVQECIKDCECALCGAKELTFRDRVSMNEYYITGWCQKCQDKTFNN